MGMNPLAAGHAPRSLMPRARKSPAEVSATRRKAALARWGKVSPEERSIIAHRLAAARREVAFAKEEIRQKEERKEA